MSVVNPQCHTLLRICQYMHLIISTFNCSSYGDAQGF